MSTTAATVTTIAAFALSFGGWSYWLKAYLDVRFAAIEERLGRVEAQLERVATLLGDQGERIARLEQQAGG